MSVNPTEPNQQSNSEEINQLDQSGVAVADTSTDKNDDPIIEFCEKNKYEYFRGSKTDVLSRIYNSVKKYSLLTILFVIGLIFVSAVKNETRNLQKDINNLKASIDIIKFN